MKDETTSRLNQLLRQVESKEATETFISDHVLPDGYSFPEYLKTLIAAKDITIAQLTARSGISKNYVYQILNGTRKSPGRDKAIALCIAAGASYSQINRGLSILKLGSLYPKDERDVRIAVAVNNGICDVIQINIILHDKGFPPLDI